MPPKKRNLVVGTVSTRSTRRQSIVNIEIVPKGNKFTKANTSKKSSKHVSNASSEAVAEKCPNLCVDEETSVANLTRGVKASEALNISSEEDASELLSAAPGEEANETFAGEETSEVTTKEEICETVEVAKGEGTNLNIAVAAEEESNKTFSITAKEKESVEPMQSEIITIDKKEEIMASSLATEEDKSLSSNESLLLSPEQTRPEILEILNDWSDEENSGDIVFAVHKKRNTLAEDQQSLIDILEGNTTEPQDIMLPKPIKNELLSNNPVIAVDSPKSDDNIIEECVVEDDFNIVSIDHSEYSQEATTSSNEGKNSKNKSTKNLNHNIKIRIQTGNEVQSMIFKKTSDGVVAIQEESSSDNHEMHSNDSNYEVIEEKVICGSLEPIIENLEQKLENVLKVKPKVQSNIFSNSERTENVLCQKINKSMQITSKTQVESDKLQESISKMSITAEVKEKIPKKHWKKSLYLANTSPTSPKKSSEKKCLEIQVLNSESDKSKPKKDFIMQVIDTKKMDFDYEMYKLKSLETEGDSTSNDSNQPQKSKKNSKSNKKIDPSSSQIESLKQMRSEIDDTINEVLRKYTYEDPDSSSNDVSMSSPKETKKPTKKKKFKLKKDRELSEEVRRSDRIKTILPVKKKSHGLVKSKSEPASADEGSVQSDSDKPTPTASPKPSPKLNKSEKTKTKSKSAENLNQIESERVTDSPQELPKPINIKADKSGQSEIAARLKTFAHLKENQYKTDRQICKEAKEMVCDCYLAEEDIQKDEYGCGDDCLNRLLMIECGELCQVGERCTNKKFQKSSFAPVEVFKTEKKGLGLRAAANIAYGEFILEYVGEVLDPDEFDKRAEVYSKDKNIHFYFMSLRSDAIIDATMKGNISRFINHSCDPNAETQKWTVNGELRIGFFSTRTILAGEEITFDYQFQRYGKEAQKCYCEAPTCRGWLGERPDESEDEEEEEEEEPQKIEPTKADAKISPEIIKEQTATENIEQPEKMDVSESAAVETETTGEAPIQEAPKKTFKKKARKEILYEDFDQLNEDIEMLVTTGLKNQAHTLKLSRLMVRSKDLEQRKKLLRVLRRGELPCRRLFLDYHGLRLMHGYMIDAQQLTKSDLKVANGKVDVSQTKLELLQTLAVLPIQNKTMLIESKVLPAVEKWAKNEDIIEDGDQKDVRRHQSVILDPNEKEKIDEIKFLATKLLEEWRNLKESFRIPKKQRIEQMKEHEKEANRKFMEVSYAQEKESSRKNDQRYRTWSRWKTERETTTVKKRHEDKERPSAEFLKISKHERRKLFALQMELKEEERRLKQREMWRQHEMNCMMIGADPRFTAPFDPSKGFQYIWNPSLGQWQALPVPTTRNQSVFSSPVVTPHSTPGVKNFNVPPPKPSFVGHYPSPIMNLPGTSSQYPGMQTPLLPMVPGITTSAMATPVMSSNVLGISPLPNNPGISGIVGTLPGINTPPLALPTMYQEVKDEDPSQVKFAGPIPPPAKLPAKWKCAKDKYGRPYYYHVKIRKSQWEPPPLPEPEPSPSESSSSESSSTSSTESSSDSDSDDDDIDDAKLLLEVRQQMEDVSKVGIKSAIPDRVKKEVATGGDSASVTPSPEIKLESDNEETPLNENKLAETLSSIDIRLKEQFNLDSADPPKKKRREGLCQEIIISPRTEEDRKHFKENMKRYKATKEKLKRQKEQMLLQSKKKIKLSSSNEEVKKRLVKIPPVKSRHKEMLSMEDDHAKKIKESFRSNMANTVVNSLNVYRKSDCKEARITTTEDFKHLARKLTHHVMVKEMKHISTIDDLICTDNVKAKAREFIKKYMSKFGDVYHKRPDEPDFKD